ncbi:MAG: Cryptochrome-like protein cry2 [Pseudomonadota bacterium]
MSYNLVWFKRDLRWHDHAALWHANQRGPIRCLYVVEPELWAQPDVALQHFEFIRESLMDLDSHLRTMGGQIEIHHGDMTSVLTSIWTQAPFTGLYSHEETGNGFTYARDRRVAQWCQQHGVAWHEFPQFGVVRGLKNRDLWKGAWEKHMLVPQFRTEAMHFWRACNPNKLDMHAPTPLQHNPPLRQKGGRTLALKTLHSFLNARSLGYRGGISSPLSAPDACSRLSAYLTFGCISMREVVQHTRSHIAALPPQASRQRAGLSAFVSRLYWHCHFIQKLESEPAIEYQNMHRGYDGLRENDFNTCYFEALQQGKTGWPMVDACVVMLKETGWLNFRMRAMLVSVAAYPLWLHWRPVGNWLATQFLDYEPGIHWSQLQMQSGTTGINTTRVYNPVKQAQDHDPQGKFVKRWLPRMRQVPQAWVLQPWLMPAHMRTHADSTIDIVEPLVDLATATRAAKQRLYELRRNPSVKAGKKAVIEKHASRNTTPASSATSRLSKENTRQLGWDFF